MAAERARGYAERMEPTRPGPRRLLAALCALLAAQSTGAAGLGAFAGPAGRFLAPRAASGPPPAAPPAAPPEQSAAPLEAAWTPPLEEPPPAADRILIAGGSGVVGAYGELEAPASPARRPPAYSARFEGYWTRGEGVSVRVDYLRPWGLNRADAAGYTLLFRGLSPRRLEAEEPVPPVLRREHPIYFAGDEVEIELTLRNDGARPLRGLLVETRQEGVTEDGSAGPPLGARRRLEAGALAPGASATLRWRTRMSGRGRGGINFEQTAVRVSGEGEDGKLKLYLDAAQAGIVDPPGP